MGAGGYFSGVVRLSFRSILQVFCLPQKNPQDVFVQTCRSVLHHLQFLSKGQMAERKWRFGSGCLENK